MPTSYTWTLLEPPAATLSTDAEESVVDGEDLPRDIALDLSTGELDVSTGGLRLTRGAEAVAQAVFIRLRFFKGEWFLDEDAGTPFYEHILVKAPQADLIRAAFRDRILETPGVSDVPSLTLDYDGPTRSLEVSFTATTDFGAFAGELVVSP